MNSNIILEFFSLIVYNVDFDNLFFIKVESFNSRIKKFEHNFILIIVS